jgi:hypothetical protein
MPQRRRGTGVLGHRRYIDRGLVEFGHVTSHKLACDHEAPRKGAVADDAGKRGLAFSNRRCSIDAVGRLARDRAVSNVGKTAMIYRELWGRNERSIG